MLNVRDDLTNHCVVALRRGKCRGYEIILSFSETPNACRPATQLKLLRAFERSDLSAAMNL